MRKVFKYEIDVTGNIAIEMPREAQILTVQDQYHKPCIWALVDPDNEKETRNFRIFGTGHSIEEENLCYIDTFQRAGGAFVWHLFEVKS